VGSSQLESGAGDGKVFLRGLVKRAGEAKSTPFAVRPKMEGGFVGKLGDGRSRYKLGKEKKEKGLTVVFARGGWGGEGDWAKSEKGEKSRFIS